MDNFWNERYGNEEYAYGKSPNAFLKQELVKLEPGKILFPAEGEGRNAVFAARLGWDAHAFDPSIEGKKKAELLAAKNKVTINYELAGYQDVSYPTESFDCIAFTYTHMPSELRKVTHKKLSTFLKPGGTIIMEAFSKQQIDKNTGGPKNIDFLFSEAELKKDFSEFSEIKIIETDTRLDEGPYHQGIASVVRLMGRK